MTFDVSILFGGQLSGRSMRLFQIYAAGNFIEATPDTPFLQIGEHKYGKPILDRAMDYDTDLYDGVKLVLVSMDSTLRSNLTVGMPIDLLVYRRDAMRRRTAAPDHRGRPLFRHDPQRWSEALRDAYRAMPRPDWAPRDRPGLIAAGRPPHRYGRCRWIARGVSGAFGGPPSSPRSDA